VREAATVAQDNDRGARHARSRQGPGGPEEVVPGNSIHVRMKHVHRPGGRAAESRSSKAGAIDPKRNRHACREPRRLGQGRIGAALASDVRVRVFDTEIRAHLPLGRCSAGGGGKKPGQRGA